MPTSLQWRRHAEGDETADTTAGVYRVRHSPYRNERQHPVVLFRNELVLAHFSNHEAAMFAASFLPQKPSDM